MSWLLLQRNTPSQNLGEKMPVLNFRVLIDCEFKVKFQFYQKSMTSKMTVLRGSALSWTSKKVILANGFATRLFNRSPDLVSGGEAEKDVDEYLYKLMRSDYCIQEGRQIECMGKRQYENVVMKVEDGKRPMYRTACELNLERAV